MKKSKNKLFNFGSHFGIAFQVADDVLDFTKNSEELGKPANNDLRSGLTTAPIYFAQAETKSEEIISMINRRYKEPGDVEKSIEILNKTSGINLSKHLVLLDIKEAIEWLNSATKIDQMDMYYKGLAKLTLMVGTRNY